MQNKERTKPRPMTPLDALIDDTLADLYRRRAELQTAISTLEEKIYEQPEEGSSRKNKTKATGK